LSGGEREFPHPWQPVDNNFRLSQFLGSSPPTFPPASRSPRVDPVPAHTAPRRPLNRQHNIFQRSVDVSAQPLSVRLTLCQTLFTKSLNRMRTGPTTVTVPIRPPVRGGTPSQSEEPFESASGVLERECGEGEYPAWDRCTASLDAFSHKVKIQVHVLY